LPSIETDVNARLLTRSDRPGSRFAAALAEVVVHVVSSAAETKIEPVLVSIVIPTYQHRQKVQDALARALAQETTVEYEVIVVDDGSTDGTDREMLRLVQETTGRLRYLRLGQNLGRATARNAGIAAARGSIIAFTDSDCLPTPGWLEAGRHGFNDRTIGIIQGPTRPHPDQPRPFFNHFIEIERFDGTFSTCNVFYRRDAIVAVDGFDPAIEYWEDLDLGWRVQRGGWKSIFAPSALVHHQVLPLSWQRWLRWPLHFSYMPAKTASYPEYRRYLFLGLWVSWFHALFDLALVAVLLGVLTKRYFLALVFPYLVAFPSHHGVGGRWPPAKAAFHLVWDTLSFGVLLINSLRYRSLVL